MRTRSALPLPCLAVLVLAALFAAADAPPTATPPPGGAGAGSIEEVSKQLSNPIASIWSMAFQQNNYRLEITGHSDQWNSNLNFQPMLPVGLTDDWALITRPVVTLFNSAPHPGPRDPSQLERTTKLGVAAQYMVRHPSNFGQKWNVQINIVPVMPKLVKGNLL